MELTLPFNNVTIENLEDFTKKVETQIVINKIEEIIFFTNDLKISQIWRPYLDTITYAAYHSNIKLEKRLMQ